MPAKFQLLSNSIIAIIKGVFIFFNVTNNHKYIKVFKLLVYLGTRAHTAVLPKDLYTYNLSLLKGPSYLKATAFYRVSIGFPFKSSQDFKGGKVNINK